MAHGDIKNLPRRTGSDKVLGDKAFSINKNPKYDRYQRGLTSVVGNFFVKKFSVGVVTRARSETLAT